MEQTTSTNHHLSWPLALIEALVANLIWGSSFVFVKIALQQGMGPLTIAGLRYFLGFVVLLPFILRRRNIVNEIIPVKVWLNLAAIGICSYSIGNGAMFWSLKYLPATTVSFMLSLLPLIILAASVLWLREIPTWIQVLGVLVTLAGGGLFFSPGLAPGQPAGLVITLFGLAGFTIMGILSRGVARDSLADTLSLTAVPLAIGGVILILLALPLEGLPPRDVKAWSMVLIMAVANTAFAYILYNHSLQVLTALEENVMLNLAPLGTAALAWLLIGEKLGLIQILGIAVVIVGVILVQTHPEPV